MKMTVVQSIYQLKKVNSYENIRPLSQKIGIEAMKTAFDEEAGKIGLEIDWTVIENALKQQLGNRPLAFTSTKAFSRELAKTLSRFTTPVFAFPDRMRDIPDLLALEAYATKQAFRLKERRSRSPHPLPPEGQTMKDECSNKHITITSGDPCIRADLPEWAMHSLQSSDYAATRISAEVESFLFGLPATEKITFDISVDLSACAGRGEQTFEIATNTIESYCRDNHIEFELISGEDSNSQKNQRTDSPVPHE